MRFEPYDPSHHLKISVTGDSADQTCDSPCTLHLLPGKLQLQVTGDEEFHKEIVVPHGDSIARLASGGRAIRIGLGVGCLVLFGVDLAVGYLGLTGGITLNPVLAYFDVGLSFVFLALGITAIVLGALNRPAVDIEEVPKVTQKDPPSFPVRLVSLGIAPAPGGGSVAGARFAF
jgi:hypothetical protein